MKSYIPSFFLRQPGELFKRLLQGPLLKWLGAPFTAQAVKALCALAAVVLIVFDFQLLEDGIEGNTWSELMRTYGQTQWGLPWLCGVLIGHLFHRDDEVAPAFKLTADEAYNVMFWLTGLVLLFGTGMWAVGYQPPEVAMTLVAVLGCAAGYYLWPLNRKDDPAWTW